MFREMTWKNWRGSIQHGETVEYSVSDAETFNSRFTANSLLNINKSRIGSKVKTVTS